MDIHSLWLIFNCILFISVWSSVAYIILQLNMSAIGNILVHINRRICVFCIHWYVGVGVRSVMMTEERMRVVLLYMLCDWYSLTLTHFQSDFVHFWLRLSSMHCPAAQCACDGSLSNMLGQPLWQCKLQLWWSGPPQLIQLWQWWW